MVWKLLNLHIKAAEEGDVDAQVKAQQAIAQMAMEEARLKTN